jgi:alpha/beta superfamily hydrolase
MDVFLVVSIARELARSGIAALRFNFCGVGESGGAFTDGRSEPSDVLGALESLSSHEDVDTSRMGLAGWSFGAWMALVALAEGADASMLVAVAPPLNMYDWRPWVDAVRASTARRHYVLGERDQFCSEADLEQFATSISATEALSIHILKRADHFLFTREAEVASLVTRLLGEELLKG